MGHEDELILGTGTPYFPDGQSIGQQLITIPTDSLMHMHCIGKSGYGKSYWLASLFLMLLSRGLSATLLDPSGDLARLVLKLLVQSRFFETCPDAFERLVYLDIPRGAKQHLYMPFNVLHTTLDPYNAADMVLEAFKRAWPALKGGTATTIEILVRTGAYVLALNKLPLLPYLVHLFTNPQFREQLLLPVTDEIVRSVFTAYGFTRGGQIPASLVPTIKRLHLLSFSPVLRYSLGQQDNVLDFRSLLDGNRSVVMNLNVPSYEAMRFLGCFTTVYAEAGAKSRGDTDISQRHGKHVLIIDEFQNFVAQSGDALTTIFEESRKYGLFLCMAHQSWAQAPEEIRGALNQCEVEVTFHLERTDAKLSEEAMGFPFRSNWRKPTPINPRKPLDFTPQFFTRQEQRDSHKDTIVNLAKREAIVRLPGSHFYYMQTLPIDVSDVTDEALSTIENTYFTKYFRSRDQIEAEHKAHVHATSEHMATASDTPFGQQFDADRIEPETTEQGDDYDLF